MFSGFTLIIVISSLGNIGLLYQHVNCLNDENSYAQNLGRDRKDVDEDTKVSQEITRTLDKRDKFDLKQRQDADAIYGMQSNTEIPNIKMLSNAPYLTPVNQARLQSKTKHSKPPLKNSEKRKTFSKSKSIDKVNNKVMPRDGGCPKLSGLHTIQQETKVQEKNELGNRNLILPEGFAEVLQEHNNILKELLLKIVHSDNITGKTADQPNTRMIHLILDINNIESKNFDLELNPILKFRGEHDQGLSNMELAYDKNCAGADANGAKNVLGNLDQNTYVPYQYNGAFGDVPTQAPLLKESGRNKNRQDNVISQNMNDIHLSTTDKTSTVSSTYNDIATASPQHSYNGYIYSPISQLYSTPYYSYQNPLYSYYGFPNKYV